MDSRIPEGGGCWQRTRTNSEWQTRRQYRSQWIARMQRVARLLFSRLLRSRIKIYFCINTQVRWLSRIILTSCVQSIVFVFFGCKCGNCIVASLQNISECYCCSKLDFAVSYSSSSEGRNYHILMIFWASDGSDTCKSFKITGGSASGSSCTSDETPLVLGTGSNYRIQGHFGPPDLQTNITRQRTFAQWDM